MRFKCLDRASVTLLELHEILAVGMRASVAMVDNVLIKNHRAFSMMQAFRRSQRFRESHMLSRTSILEVTCDPTARCSVRTSGARRIPTPRHGFSNLQRGRCFRLQTLPKLLLLNDSPAILATTNRQMQWGKLLNC